MKKDNIQSMHRYGKEKGGKEHQKKQKENIRYLGKQDFK